MANTLTGLIPIIYTALDQVVRELTGMIPAVYMNASGDGVALNETIRYPVVGSMTAADVAAAATGPDPSAQTITYEDMTLDKSRSVTFYWEGEEQKGFKNSGTYADSLTKQFAQAMRVLRNEIELDLVTVAKQGASRAFGTAGTAPFTSAFTSIAEVRQILAENGAPMSDMQLVIPLSWGTDLRQIANLYKVNEAGEDDLLRRGVITDLQGFAIRESAQIGVHTKGTGTGYLNNVAGGSAVGSTSMALDTGSGTILAGDVVTFAADSTNKYVVGGYSAPTLSLNAPGLKVLIPENNAMTIGNNYTPGLAFQRYGVHLLTRVPAMPEGGDAADDVTVVTDPGSGLSFQVAVYRQRRRVSYEVAIAWGKKVVKSDYVATLLG